VFSFHVLIKFLRYFSKLTLESQEKEVTVTSSVSLWTQEQIAEMWNRKGRTIGCPVRENLWIFDPIQAVGARPVERFFCKWFVIGCAKSFASRTGRFNLGKIHRLNNEYLFLLCYLFIIIISKGKWILLRIIQHT